MIRTETYCDACNEIIDTELPPWATLSVVVFPEKTPRVFHYCRDCYPKTLTVPPWATALHVQVPTTRCEHPLGPETTLQHCSLCAKNAPKWELDP